MNGLKNHVNQPILWDGERAAAAFGLWDEES
jgi:hypothetical protein